MRHIRPDIKRLGPGYCIAVVASAALMVGVFLPWFEFGDPVTGNFSFSATDLRTWMYLPVGFTLVVVGSVVIKGAQRRARFAAALWLIVVGACGADLVLTVACFAKRSPGVRWDFGAYISLAAAVAALAGAVVSRRRLAPPRDRHAADPRSERRDAYRMG